MNTTTKLITLLVLALLPVIANAHDVQIDGIYYVLDDKHATATVCNYTNSMVHIAGTEYVGDIVIPESITTEAGKTYTVTAIGRYAFADCSDVTSITLPNTILSFGEQAFINCPLTTLSIPNSLETIGEACFSGSMGLTELTFPETLRSIGNQAFYLCRNLVNIYIPNSLTSIGQEVFSYTAWLDNQPDGVIYAGPFAYSYKGEIPQGTADIKQGTRYIADYAFSECSTLARVIMPNSVTSIGIRSFRSCPELEYVELPDSLIAVGYQAFSGCPEIQSFDFPSTLKSVGFSAFSGTAWYDNQPDGLVYTGTVAYHYKGRIPEGTDFTIPDGTTSLGDELFSEDELYSPDDNYEGLHSVTIPNSVRYLGDCVFYDCYPNLSKISIGSGVEDMGKCSLAWIFNLTEVNISEGVKLIGEQMFSGCSNLKEINIPNSVEVIKYRAFAAEEYNGQVDDYPCKSLAKVTIGSGVKSIEEFAFSGCEALTEITCLATTPPVLEDGNCFDDECYNNATLFVPAEAIDAYKRNSIWRRFTNIQSIEPNDNNGYEYIPFVREGVKWVYYIDDYNYHVDFYTNPARGNNTVYRTLELKGDTLINGKIYKAMHLYSGESIDEENDTIPVFLREEDKKVYGIIPNGAKYDHCRIYNFWDERLNGFDHWYNGEEFLLYDFQDPAAQWENLLNSFDYDEDFYTYTRLFTDTIPLGNKLAKRYVGEINSHEYQTIEGVGLIGYNSTPFLLFQPLFAGIHDEIYGLEKVVENGEVIYPQNYVEDGYLPLISEGVKWVNERVTVNHGDTTCYYYTYEFKGNHPVTGIWGLQRKALYRYEGLNHQLDTEQDSIVSGLRENGAKVSYFNNVPLDDVISQGRDMIDFQGTSEAYDFDDDYDYGHRLLYGMSTTVSGWLNSKDYYTEFQRESFLNDDNFVKADPIMIDGYKCSRLAYIGEQGDTLAYIVEGIGFDSRDMGDLLTPFTRRPDPNADYQEWCGLSHVIKDGKIIYKGLRYRPNLSGDVNGDGEITIADANNVIDVVVMGGNSGHTRVPAADVNGDGEVNIGDINAIIDMILSRN